MKPPTFKHALDKKSALAFALVGAVLMTEVLAKDYSASTHFYAIEFRKPTVGDVAILNVTFNRRLEGQVAERILREELERAVTLFPPKGEVLAYAWTQTDPMPGTEKMIPLPDDSTFLVYSPKTKQMLTEKHYDLSRQRPAQPGKAIDVEISLDFERSADGRVRVLGKTNLPHGMLVIVDLRNTKSKYFAQSKVEVIDGRLVSGWFSNSGRALETGQYEISVSSSLPEFQPKEVRTITGESGENLVGAVRTWMGSKMVEYKTTKALN